MLEIRVKEIPEKSLECTRNKPPVLPNISNNSIHKQRFTKKMKVIFFWGDA